MKKVIIVFCLCLVTVFVSAQLATDSVCRANIEKIFSAVKFKIKSDAVEHYYRGSMMSRNSIRIKSKEGKYYLDDIRIKDFPLNLETRKDSTGADVKIETEHDVTKLIYDAWVKAGQEYRGLIQAMKSDKEICLKCIDAELAKGELSDYAHKQMFYHYKPPESSLSAPAFAKLDYLDVFKEFILNEDGDYLPDFLIAVAFLKCGCKISGYRPKR